MLINDELMPAIPDFLDKGTGMKGKIEPKT